jgi:outer membrane protein assembly factor BamB
MKRCVTVILVASMLVGCASRAVREPPAALVEFKPTLDIREAWSTNVSGKTKDWVGLVPTLSDGVVYVAGPQGRVVALAADSGRIIWETDVAARIGGAVGVGDGLVLLGTRRGEVLALERATGKKVWAAPVSSEVLAPPAAAAGVVVAQAVDGMVFGLAVKDGKRLWADQRSEPALSLRGTGAPVIVGDAVLAGFANGKLAALDLSSGRARWEATVAAPRGRNEIERLVDIDVTPLVLTDAIYTASYQGKLVALQPSSGTVGWSRDVSTYSGLASDGANIYISDDNGRVLAFDRRSGASVWKQEALRARRVSAPVVFGDYVVVGDFEGYTHWLARDDGRFVARHRVGSAPIRAPAVTDGEALYVLGQGGTLAAIKPK